MVMPTKRKNAVIFYTCHQSTTRCNPCKLVSRLLWLLEGVESDVLSGRAQSFGGGIVSNVSHNR